MKPLSPVARTVDAGSAAAVEPLSDNGYERSASKAAVRMRRRRERERRNAVVVVIEVGPDLTDGLVDVGAITMGELEDRSAIGRALLDLSEHAIDEIKRAARRINSPTAARRSE